MTKNKLFLLTFLVSFFSTLEARELPNFSDLAEKSSPAVVNITSSRTVKERNAYGRGFGDPRYDEFFERFFGQQPRPSTPRENTCLLYTSPSPRDATLSRMPSSA